LGVDETIEKKMIKKAIQRVTELVANRLVDPLDKLAYDRFYRFPFGNAPLANADTYKDLWAEAKNKSYPGIDAYEKEMGYAIDQDWFQQLALQTQVVIKQSDLCYQHGRLLYSRLAHYVAHHRPKTITILETGTARGFSALCMARALRDSGQPGKIITFDVLPHQVKMFWNCIADAQGPQTRAELLKDYDELIEEYVIFHQGDTRLELKKVDLPRVHLAFLDGMHTYKYVMYEYGLIKDRQKAGDIIFFDDYTPQFFPGVVRAVDEICDRYGYEKRMIAVSEQRGYVIAHKK
jgi:predicted O-methyltransferase YrrM